MNRMKIILKSKKAILSMLSLSALSLALTGCEFTPDKFGAGWNVIMTILIILAGLVLLFFIVFGIISAFYKGKDVEAKVIEKLEPKVMRGNLMGKTSPGYKNQTDMTRRARRQKGRVSHSKIIVEIDGEKKTIRCNDNVILDKLKLGKVNKIRIRFNEVIKILK